MKFIPILIGNFSPNYIIEYQIQVFDQFFKPQVSLFIFSAPHFLASLTSKYLPNL